mmetsp:Transcript_42157/g.111453  ORF Transcript_42157/g.111453 Transcript_42157/m.111453 type:complete len:379 (+) Transcript_42157:694-1830(+)
MSSSSVITGFWSPRAATWRWKVSWRSSSQLCLRSSVLLACSAGNWRCCRRSTNLFHRLRADLIFNKSTFALTSAFFNCKSFNFCTSAISSDSTMLLTIIRRKLTPSPRWPDGSARPVMAKRLREELTAAMYSCVKCQGVNCNSSKIQRAQRDIGWSTWLRLLSKVSSSSTAARRVLSKVRVSSIPRTRRRLTPRSRDSSTHTSSGFMVASVSWSPFLKQSLHSLRIMAASRWAHHFNTSSTTRSSVLLEVSCAAVPFLPLIFCTSLTIFLTQRLRFRRYCRVRGAQTSCTGSVCPTVHTWSMRRMVISSALPVLLWINKKSVGFALCTNSGARMSGESRMPMPCPIFRRTRWPRRWGRGCEPTRRIARVPKGPNAGPS